MARAVERAIPFQLACQAIAVTWYITKAQPSIADMVAKLRRVLIGRAWAAP